MPMQRIINNIKAILSHKWATIAILLISTVSRVIHLVFFFNIRIDRSYQLLATQNFVHGNGITTAWVMPGDLSTIIYTPLIKWPPGYSLLLSPFYSLSGYNYLLSSLFLDLIFSIILIFVTRAILKLLDISLYLINLYTFITSFFIYYFYFITSSDAITTTFFVIALYYTLLFLKARLNWLKAVALITLLLFICGSMKYLFMPVVFVIPFFLALKGFIDKNKKILKTGVLSFVILSTGLIALLFYQKHISGNPAYISDAASGFFPSNLLSAYPLIPGSLMKPDTVALLLNKPEIEAHITFLFRWIYLFVIAAAILCSSWLLYKYRCKKLKLTSDFFCLTTGVCFITTLLLAALSVRVAKAEDMPGNWWTFIQEPRYYGLPNILIHISIFVFFQYYLNKKTNVLKYFFYFLLLLLLPELFRGIIFTAKRVINFKREEYSWQDDLRFQKYADAIIKKERKSDEKPIVTGSGYYTIIRVSLYSNVPQLNDAVQINALPLMKSKKPVLLLVILHEKTLESFRSFISDNGKQAIGYYNGYYFYTVHIGNNYR